MAAELDGEDEAVTPTGQILSAVSDMLSAVAASRSPPATSPTPFNRACPLAPLPPSLAPSSLAPSLFARSSLAPFARSLSPWLSSLLASSSRAKAEVPGSP